MTPYQKYQTYMQTKVTKEMVNLTRGFHFEKAPEDLSKMEFLSAFQYTDRIRVIISHEKGFYTITIIGRVVYWYARPIRISAQSRYVSRAFMKAITKYLRAHHQVVKSFK